MNIYVASSWRNKYQQMVVELLRNQGYHVYDFRNPSDNDHGFHWSDIDSNWMNWTPEEYKKALTNTIAEKGFKNDFDAMKWAQVCVLVLPCGRSAHTEAGWMKGQRKPTFVLMLDKEEPELMYKVFNNVCITTRELLNELKEFDYGEGLL